MVQITCKYDSLVLGSKITYFYETESKILSSLTGTEHTGVYVITKSDLINGYVKNLVETETGNSIHHLPIFVPSITGKLIHHVISKDEVKIELHVLSDSITSITFDFYYKGQLVHSTFCELKRSKIIRFTTDKNSLRCKIREYPHLDPFTSVVRI